MEDRSNVVAAMLAIFLGTFGLHKFYMGKIGMGVAYLLVSVLGSPVGAFVLVGLFSCVEGVIYLSHKNKDFNRKYCK